MPGLFGVTLAGLPASDHDVGENRRIAVLGWVLASVFREAVSLAPNSHLCGQGLTILKIIHIR